MATSNIEERGKESDRSEDTQVNSNKNNLKDTGATPKLMTFNTSQQAIKSRKARQVEIDNRRSLDLSAFKGYARRDSNHHTEKDQYRDSNYKEISDDTFQFASSTDEEQDTVVKGKLGRCEKKMNWHKNLNMGLREDGTNRQSEDDQRKYYTGRKGKEDDWNQIIYRLPIDTNNQPTFNGTSNITPKDFLKRLQTWMEDQQIQQKEKLMWAKRSLRGAAKLWEEIFCEDIYNFEQWTQEFLKKFWNRERQQKELIEMYNGRYRTEDISSMAPYFLKMIKKVKDIDLITVEEAINPIINHFPIHTARILTSTSPKTVLKIYEILEHLDSLENRNRQNRFQGRNNIGYQFSNDNSLQNSTYYRNVMHDNRQRYPNNEARGVRGNQNDNADTRYEVRRAGHAREFPQGNKQREDSTYYNSKNSPERDYRSNRNNKQGYTEKNTYSGNRGRYNYHQNNKDTDSQRSHYNVNALRRQNSKEREHMHQENREQESEYEEPAEN